MDILSNFAFWGGGWTGWIVPFLFGLSIVVFFHELGHFLVARWCGVRVLTFSVGFRTGTRRLHRPIRDALEDFGHPAWRLREVLRRRECRKRSGRDDGCGHDAGGAQVQLLPSAGGQARGHRGSRADCEFHPGDRDLRWRSSCSTASRRRWRASTRCSPSPRRRRPDSARRRDRGDRRHQDRQLLRTCSGSSAATQAARCASRSTAAAFR